MNVTRIENAAEVDAAIPLERVLTGQDPTDGSPAIFDVYAGIRNGLRVLPSAYLPSNIDLAQIRWLIYFYYLNVATGAAFGVSPWLGRLRDLLQLVRCSGVLSGLRFQCIVVQVAPSFSQACVGICYHCPDATIRYGVLFPVCHADWLPPAGDRGGAIPDAVCRHLVEA